MFGFDGDLAKDLKKYAKSHGGQDYVKMSVKFSKGLKVMRHDFLIVMP